MLNVLGIISKDFIKNFENMKEFTTFDTWSVIITVNFVLT